MSNVSVVPRRQRIGSLVFSIVLLLVSVLVVITVTHDPVSKWLTAINAPYLPLFVLTIFLSLLSVSFALGNPQSPKDLAATASLLIIPGFLLALSVMRLRYPVPAASFWFMLLAWTIIAIVILQEEARGWKRFLLLLATIWTVSGLICILGELPFYPYAKEPLAQLRLVHILLDVRVFTSLAFIICFLVTAVHRAFGVAPPKIPDISLGQFSPPWDQLPGLVSAILAPLVIIVNFLLRIIGGGINFIWKVVAYFFAYSYFISREVGKLLAEVFSRRSFVRLCRISVAFCFCFVLVVLADSLLEPAVRYLLSDGWSGGMEILPQFAGLCGLAFVTSVLIAFIIFPRKIVVQNASYGLSYILGIFLLAGVVLYLLQWRQVLVVRGFSDLGPFTIIFSILLFLGLLFVSLQKSPGISGEERKPQEFVNASPGWIHGVAWRDFKALQVAVLFLAIVFIGWIAGQLISWKLTNNRQGASISSGQIRDSIPAVRLPVTQTRVASEGTSAAMSPSSGSEADLLEQMEKKAEPPTSDKSDRFGTSTLRGIREDRLIEEGKTPRVNGGDRRLAPREVKDTKLSDHSDGLALSPAVPSPREPNEHVSAASGNTKVQSGADAAGWLDLSVVPKDASVYLNGNRLDNAGEFPVLLREGAHMLMVTKEGYEVRQQTLKIVEGQNLVLNVVLEPDPRELLESHRSRESLSIRESRPQLANRSLAAAIRNKNIGIYYTSISYPYANILKARLEQLGGRVTLHMASTQERKAKVGVYFTEENLNAARGVKLIAEELEALSLFRWDKRQEDVSVYLVN